MNNAVLLVLCLLPLGVLLHQSRRLDVAEQRLRAITRMDAKLDLLLKHARIFLGFRPAAASKQDVTSFGKRAVIAGCAVY
jgi:hypothetical protein